MEFITILDVIELIMSPELLGSCKNGNDEKQSIVQGVRTSDYLGALFSISDLIVDVSLS